MKRGLDLNKLKDREVIIISLEESLKDVIPISWNETKKNTITCDKENQ